VLVRQKGSSQILKGGEILKKNESGDPPTREAPGTAIEGGGRGGGFICVAWRGGIERKGTSALKLRGEGGISEGLFKETVRKKAQAEKRQFPESKECYEVSLRTREKRRY